MIQVIEKYVVSERYKYKKRFQISCNYVNLSKGDLVQDDVLTTYVVDRQVVKNKSRYVIVVAHDMDTNLKNLINETE